MNRKAPASAELLRRVAEYREATDRLTRARILLHEGIRADLKAGVLQATLCDATGFRREHIRRISQGNGEAA